MPNFTTAFVTGSTGFIGRALVRRLSDAQVTAYCLVRPSSNVAAISALDNVHFVQAATRSDLFEQLSSAKPEVVFHLAAAGVDPSERSPDKLLGTNVELLSWLLTASAELGVRRFVNVGSCSEYSSQDISYGRLHEDSPCLPTTLYGGSKAAGTAFGNALAQHLGLPFTTLRLFGVLGPGEKDNRLVPMISRYLREGRPVPLSGGEQVRDFLFVDDVAEALFVSAAANDQPRRSVYNVCSGIGTSIRQIAEWTAALLHQPTSLLNFGALPYRSGEPMYVVGDATRFTTDTGWVASTTLHEGIRRTLEHTQRQHAPIE